MHHEASMFFLDEVYFSCHSLWVCHVFMTLTAPGSRGTVFTGQPSVHGLLTCICMTWYLYT